MKIFKTSIILALIITFFSCEKSEVSQDDLNILSKNNTSFLNKRLLTENELISLGNKHNDYLNDYFRNNNTANDRDSLIDEFMILKDFDWNYTDSKNGVSYVIDESISMQSDNYSTANFINNFSSVGQGFITSLDNHLMNATSINDLNNQIDDVVDDIRKSKLSIKDKNGILGYAYIMKSSAKLWAPTSIGGEGLFDAINGSTNRLSSRGWSWNRAGRGDAAASMTYFLGIGLTIVAPPAGLAVLTAWAWSAAAGSVVAGAGLI